MIEQFANDAESTLDGDIDDSVTSLDIASIGAFPTTGQFRIRIDDELLLVTAVSGITFTVTRGVEGTTADSHTDTTSVVHVLTKAAREKWREDNVGSDTLANRPAAGRTGALFIPSDGLSIQRDSGAAWMSFGPVFRQIQPPVVSDFTWVNQEGATAVDQGGTILLTDPEHNGIDARLLVKAAPSTPYTITARFVRCCRAFSGSAFVRFGLLFRDSGGDAFRAILWQFTPNSSNGTKIAVHSYAAPSGVVSALLAATFIGVDEDNSYFRIEDDGTDRNFYVSPDGITYLRIYTEANDAGFTADQVGFVLDNNVSSAAVGADSFIKLISWEQG